MKNIEELTYIGIDVTNVIQNGMMHTAARVYCKKGNCGKDITLVSDGEHTPQHVECPLHGVIAVFPNMAEYEKALKFAINLGNESKGLPTIDPKAKAKFEQDN